MSESKNRVVLVLGATGYIGGHVARAAHQAGWRVRALRRRPGATGNIGDLPVEWHEGDIDRPSSLVHALRGVDVVLHAAGYYPRAGGRVADHVGKGVRQTRDVLEACRQAEVRKVVYTSTLTTVGPPPRDAARLADERDLYLPGSLPTAFYYECKYAMEGEALRFCAGGLPLVVLNPTAVLGPGDSTPTLGGVILAAARGRGWAWLEAEVNIVDVRDVAQAHVAAVERGESGQRYLIGGHNLTVREAMDRLAAVAGVPPPRVHIPLAMIGAAAWVSDRLPALSLLGNHLHAIRHWQGYDTSRAREKLGLSPRPLEETLRDMLEEYVARGWLPRKPIVVG